MEWAIVVSAETEICWTKTGSWNSKTFVYAESSTNVSASHDSWALEGMQWGPAFHSRPMLISCVAIDAVFQLVHRSVIDLEVAPQRVEVTQCTILIHPD